MELEEGFGWASGEAGGGGVASPGAGRAECTFPFLFVCSFFAFFLLVVGEPYYDRLGRSVDRKWLHMYYKKPTAAA